MTLSLFAIHSYYKGNIFAKLFQNPLMHDTVKERKSSRCDPDIYGGAGKLSLSGKHFWPAYFDIIMHDKVRGTKTSV